MRKILYLLLLSPIIYLVSCSSGKENLTPEQLPIEETIVGVTWQLLNVGGDWFRLNDDYTYSTKASLCDTFAIEGFWSLDGDVIENRYIIGAVEYVERNTIIEFSDSLLKLQADTTPTADAYVWFVSCQPEPIRGCMDTTFFNFNPNAQCPDTCMNTPVYGCIDANALNYNAIANIDDGSCCFVGGCIDSTALNYDPNACQDDGSCCFVGGCIDNTALNYNANACYDDGSCCYIAGCMDNTALNYDPNACQDDSSCCFVGGCIDNTALNYDPNACQDDGSCCFVGGCMDITALNYNANACQDDGSCIFTAAIGDFIQGGIVFYLDGNGGGLIAAPIDQSTGAEWGCYGPNGINGAYGLTIGTGNQNTIDIEAGCNTPGTAADICANLTLGGYSDWFLPSRDELREMYLNIGEGSQLGNIGNFAPSWYWTSTQYGVDKAQYTHFSDGYSFIVAKANFLHVRAIRAF